jgi:hypothetical protein
MAAIELVAKPKPDQYTEAAWLRSRFFHIKKSGGQVVYFDSVSGDQSLQCQHLIYHLMERGSDFKDAKAIVENAPQSTEGTSTRS